MRFLIIGDTQNVVTLDSALGIHIQSQYERAHKHEPFDAIVHVGDLVNDGASKKQWKQIRRAIQRWNHLKVPIICATGNHDFDTLQSSNRSLNSFQQYIGHLLASQSAFTTSFERNRTENSFYDTGTFAFLSLELAPRREVMEWADRIARHLTIPLFVVTHSYLCHTGKRVTKGDQCRHYPLRYKPTKDGLDGEMLWQHYFKHWDTLRGVFSGHHVDQFTAERLDLNEANRPVFQAFQNWQKDKFGGGGNARICTFSDESISSTFLYPLREHST